MKTLTEIISEYETAEAQFAPYRTALRERLQAAIDTYKRIGRASSLWDWKYDWTRYVDWINVSDIEIYEHSIYMEYDLGEAGTGDASLTYDEIENAETYATAAAAEEVAKRERDRQLSKEAKRRDLQRQLADLDR